MYTDKGQFSLATNLTRFYSSGKSSLNGVRQMVKGQCVSTRDLQLGKVLLYPFFFPFHHHQLVCCCIYHEFCEGKTTKTLKFECRAQKVIGMLSFFLLQLLCGQLTCFSSLFDFFLIALKKTYLALTPWDDLRKYLVTLRSFQSWASHKRALR